MIYFLICPPSLKEIKVRGYKTCFMLNSAEREILNARQYNKYPEIKYFSGSDKPRMLFSLLIEVEMPIIDGILTL